MKQEQKRCYVVSIVHEEQALKNEPSKWTYCFKYRDSVTHLSRFSLYIKYVRNKRKVTFNIRVTQFVTTILKSGYKFPVRSPNLFTLSRDFVFRGGLFFQKQWRSAAMQLNAPQCTYIYSTISVLLVYLPPRLPFSSVRRNPLHCFRILTQAWTRDENRHEISYRHQRWWYRYRHILLV
jgi:hypothetical protein